MRNFSRLLLTVVLFLPLNAQASQWTAVPKTAGMFGYILGDNPGPWLLEWNGGAIAYGHDQMTGPISVQYNVTSETLQPGWERLTINYSGIAADSSVSATLYKVIRSTGGQVEICTVTSVPDQRFNSCHFSATALDFSKHGYYVEVVLDRRSNNSWPQINHLRLSD